MAKPPAFGAEQFEHPYAGQLGDNVVDLLSRAVDDGAKQGEVTAAADDGGRFHHRGRTVSGCSLATRSS